VDDLVLDLEDEAEDEVSAAYCGAVSRKDAGSNKRILPRSHVLSRPVCLGVFYERASNTHWFPYHASSLLMLNSRSYEIADKLLAPWGGM